ncbi:hypothetical protein [Nocardiopsis lambiniae]|uniref:PE-PGRS family protein n=1 Tax=Nocardiopsis lambiniae TaxID=3075539 RepID=A0ABU2MG97_9ACTN|nr:hypothetical protein [Nocardiopsis sp. DSM 44743]MDT0331729.1 hypothetical protein [Nocardiopsis sp. DSM 44743]
MMPRPLPVPPPRRRLRQRWREWWSIRSWRRRWERLLRLLGLRREHPSLEAPGVPPPATVHSDSFLVTAPPLDKFRTPAQGDGFTFVVRANVIWEGTATDDSPKQLAASRDRVEEEIRQRQRTIRHELMTVVRPIARGYPPFQAAELEAHLAEVLPELLSTRKSTAKPTNADSTDGRVDAHRSRGIHVPGSDGYHMRVHLWVDPCPEIRRLQQQIWTRVTARAGDGLDRRRQLTESTALQKAWREAITALLRAMGVRDPEQARWTELMALQLAHAEDQSQASETVLRQIVERYGQAARLHSELADYLWAANGSDGRVRTMDFALGSDAALTRLLDTLGVPDLDDVREDGLSEEETER